MGLTSALVVAVIIVSVVQSEVITIDETTNTCGETKTVTQGQEVIIKSTGQSAGIDCSFKFSPQVRGKCNGLCYDMKSGSFFKDPKATLKVEYGTASNVYDVRHVLMEPLCSETSGMVTVTFKVADDYAYDPKNPGYNFELGLYSFCDGQSITFEEAIKGSEGYHHGEEFHDRVRMNMIHGILVGCCLASVFLVILVITYCYYKHSPNRGRSRSTSHSKKADDGMKKKDVKKAESEPQYTYRKTDPERLERQPDSKPLLKGASADPEKPPFDPSVDPPPK